MRFFLGRDVNKDPPTCLVLGRQWESFYFPAFYGLPLTPKVRSRELVDSPFLQHRDRLDTGRIQTLLRAKVAPNFYRVRV